MTDWEHFLLYSVAAIVFFELASDDDTNLVATLACGLMRLGCLVAAVVWLLRDWSVIG